jgi:hypothetical protein
MQSVSLKSVIICTAAIFLIAAPIRLGFGQSAIETLGAYRVEKTTLGPWDKNFSTRPFLLGIPDAPPGCGPGCALGGAAFALLWDAAALAAQPLYAFSKDGHHFAYSSISKHICGDGIGICVVVDGEVQATPDLKTVGFFSFSANNQEFSYMEKGKDNKWVTVALVDQGNRWVLPSSVKAEPGSEQPVEPAGPSPVLPAPVPVNFAPVLSPDGKRTATVVPKGKRGPFTVVVDGKASDEYEGIAVGMPVFSPDSKHVVFAALKKDRHWVIVLDGREGKEYFRIGLPRFSPDSSHLIYAGAYRRVSKPWTMVEDDQESGAYEDVGVAAFSPDSKHVAFVATTTMKDNKWSVVLDNQMGERFDGILQIAPAFSPDGSLEYLSHTGDSLYRVRYVPSQ